MSWLDAFLTGAPGPAGPTGPAGPVGSVGATLPITSTGGTTPTIGINAATDSLPGSMSAADKAKLDQASSSDTASVLALRGSDGSLSAKLTNITTPVSTPAPPSTGYTVYVDVADGQLKAIDSSGRISNLTGAMGITVTSTHAMTGSSTTVHQPIFTVTGSIRVLALYGIVTVALGTNHTSSAFVFTDGSATSSLSASATTPASNAPPGSLIAVLGPFANVTVVQTSDQARAGETGTSTMLFQEMGLVANNGSTSQIGYVYTTTDTPTTGTIEFFLVYEPLSPGAVVVAV